MPELRSLRTRVTLGATAFVTLALAIGALSAAGLLRRSLEADEQSLLDDRVGSVAQLAASGTLPRVLAEVGQDIGQIQVIDAAGDVLSVTPGLAADVRLDLGPAPAVDQQVVSTVGGEAIDGHADHRYRYIARTVDTPIGPVTIHAVTSLDAATRAEEFLRNGLLLGLPLIVLGTALVVWRVVRRSLAPVDVMRREIDAIEATDLSRRLSTAEYDHEAAQLAATVNRLLERLEDDARRQTVFAAAASHELRSPLTAIRTELEVGAHYADRTDWPSVVDDVLVEVARLERLAADLRVLTRPSSPHDLGDRTTDLRAVVDAEVQRRRTNSSAAIRLDTPVDPSRTEVRGDVEPITQLVRNLLDNAQRHAHDEVSVTLRPSDDLTVVLTVANDGAPIPDDQLEAIFEPFRRLDDARSLDQGGSGLGLAIARSIMRSVGGAVRACPTDRGARFEATFQRAGATGAPDARGGLSGTTA